MIKAVKQVFEAAAQENGVELRDVFEMQTPNAMRAKRAIASRLRARGKSLTEIGNLMRCHHSTVHNLLHPRVDGGKRGKLPLAPVVIPCPDLSGEWAI